MDPSTELARAFWKGRGVASPDPKQAQWQAGLETLWAAAIQECPDVEVDAIAWCEHLGASVDQSLELKALEEYPAGDMLLAFASARGDTTAVRRLRDRFGDDVDRALGRARSVGVELDELRQRVWVKLLADGTGGRPQMLRYTGRGSLQGWIRVVVSRMVVDLLRASGAEREETVALDVLATLGQVELDPELGRLRAQFGEEVRSAMQVAFSSLTGQDRTLLRGLLVLRLTTDELGAMFEVHRTTAARWVERARTRLVEATHEALRERLGAGDQTVRSLVNMVRSQIDLSVSRLLGSNADED